MGHLQQQPPVRNDRLQQCQAVGDTFQQIALGHRLPINVACIVCLIIRHGIAQLILVQLSTYS